MNKISQTLVSDDSFNTYVKFLALKKHFTTDNYDYFKYNGKVRANLDTFMSRNDAYSFDTSIIVTTDPPPFALAEDGDTLITEVGDTIILE